MSLNGYQILVNLVEDLKIIHWLANYLD